MQVLLEMNQNTKVSVYNIMVLQKPVEKSMVNFLAPLLFNEDNGTMGQAVLSSKEYPDFGVSVAIDSFMQPA